MAAPRDSDSSAVALDTSPLAELLRADGVALSEAALRDLVAGIAAAPRPRDDESWLALVAPRLSPALCRAVIALRDRLTPPEDLGRDPARLTALRRELKRRTIDGFIVPRADEHQGEYVARRAARLAWLTGFTGSAGAAVVLADKAAVFVDGRYTLQAQAEVDTRHFTLEHLVETPPHQWIGEHLADGARLGYDPWLHTPDSVARLRAACEKAGGFLVACPDNPVDAVWSDQPPPPLAPVVAHPLRVAGRASADKRRALAEALARDKLAAAVLTAPDSIAWLLNVRGGDVPYTPLPLSFALLYNDGRVDWFVDARKLAPGLPEHLGPEVMVRPPADFGAGLDALAGQRVRLDAAGAPAWVADRLQQNDTILDKGADPCALPKARKQPVELDGMRAAHRRDAVAMMRFLAWLDGAAAHGELDELAAADRLEALRAEGEGFQGLSFPTISGAGPNGAIVHYRATPATNRRLRPGEPYLVDSGAQYLDGTTDITRTVAVGGAGPEERRRFTLVLKGHIAIARARFPAGTTGSQLDVLARLALWGDGLDYDHGTGHGVGQYLSVHEGPQRISKAGNAIALQPGMVLSNEPGYYKTGGYGIRIENLVAVREETVSGAERPMLGFETLTLVPIDRRLIEREMLSAEERAWLDAYHRRVRETVMPLLAEEPVRAWLEAATRGL